MMNVGDLYQLVLVIVLIGVICGIGIILLAKLMATSGIGQDAVDALNSTLLAIKEIPTNWLSLIITISVLVILLALVIGGFMFFGRKTR